MILHRKFFFWLSTLYTLFCHAVFVESTRAVTPDPARQLLTALALATNPIA